MTGLQIQIKLRQIGKQLDKNEPISYSGISKIIGKSYSTTRRKVDKNTFTIDEVLAIMNSGIFAFKSKYDALEYLFTNQD